MFCPVITKSPDFSFEKRKAAQQRNFCVSNNIVFSQISVNHEQVYADKFVSKFCLRRFFPLNNTSKSMPTLFRNM